MVGEQEKIGIEGRGFLLGGLCPRVDNQTPPWIYCVPFQSGCSSVIERHLAKVKVAGLNPVTRSNNHFRFQILDHRPYGGGHVR